MSRGALQARLGALLPRVSDWTAHGLPSLRQLQVAALRAIAKARLSAWMEERRFELEMEQVNALLGKG